MTHRERLVSALEHCGIEPTEAEIAKLDGQLSELAKVLVDYYFYKKNKENGAI